MGACGGTDTPTTEANADSAPAETHAPASLAATGGEGEGGVSIAAAMTDPVVYTSALAITEAHVLAARDAHAAGETRAAAEMFAHPVGEVLFDMRPVFEARGVVPFDTLLTEASAAAFEGETPAAIDARTDAIIAALRAAAEKAPEDGSSRAVIAAGVAADQIERASDMYRAARETDRYEPYLDGYGYYKAGEAAYLAAAEDIRAERAQTAAAIERALALLSAAYPTPLRPDVLGADTGALAVAASEALLTTAR